MGKTYFTACVPGLGPCTTGKVPDVVLQLVETMNCSVAWHVSLCLGRGMHGYDIDLVAEVATYSGSGLLSDTVTIPWVLIFLTVCKCFLSLYFHLV